MTIEAILARLQGVRRSGHSWKALCPAHADRNASLSVREKNGKILLHCFAGCTKDTVLAALKVDPKELFSDAPQRQRKPQIVATYDYVDERGELLYQNVRYEPKDFRLRQPDGKGGWTWSVESTLRTIYNLPAVLGATDIFITEGEKDADTGNSLGFTSTTSGAAGSWKDEFSERLRGKRIALIADADESCRKHARRVAKSLYGKVESLRALELPGAKDLTKWVEGGGTRDSLLELIQNAPEWKPQFIDGEELLMAICAFVRRFVSLSGSQAAVISLWVAHTHSIDSAETTPYLAITSAEKQCGKSRLLEVLQTIVAEPWFTGRVTPAVLVRKIDGDKPTLLLDESDAAFGGEKEYAEALRGILNTGHRRGGVASLCVGKGTDITFKDFSTFCPKAIAGIGKLPDTVADRSIPIRLKRAAPGDVVERFRLRNVKPEADALRERLGMWCETIADSLCDARPTLPDELSDRQQDGAEPLLGIADAASKGWPEIWRAALVEILTDNQSADDSIRVRLLTDIRQVFETRDTDKIPSTVLAEALAAIETSPWGEWSHGKPITAPKVARLLHPFGIAPHTVRLGDGTAKGYEVADFEDSFRRYLRPPAASLPHPPASKPSHRSHSNIGAGICDFSKPSQNQNVTLSNCEIANTDVCCDRVTVSTPIRGLEMKTEKLPVEEVL
jgi:hypothetical protein